ncbi:thioredoxin family protein [Spiroplasma endosymbiont of Nebria brevicollis]|uniref:thioredoxin family protein n=1 Tax=Spiroplasma endosymbiont of Nebria brevicollis TaxID=3066284 RepID=UPI00313B24AA
MSVQHINDKKQVAEILNSGKVSVIDFSAEWCGPCKALGPRFEKVANDKTNSNINFIKVDVDHAKTLAEQYEIASIPTLIYFDKHGNVVSRVSGLVNEQQITSNIEEAKGK